MRQSIELPTGINSHHVFYHKRSYHGYDERRFRNTPGLIVPTPLANHNLLHRKLWEGPPKPTHEEMHDLRDYLDDRHPSMKTDRLWAMEATLGFLVIMSVENEAEQPRYHDTSEHIAQQIGILSHKFAGIIYPNDSEVERYGQAA